ncbi:MAG: LptF/LptG family permease, partial [bacterium]|nr:LptF/LptG family permease [bacterium]
SLFLFTAVFSLFATKRLFDVIDLIFNRNVELNTILQIFGLLLPYFISLTLPISLLVAGLVVFGRLVLDREWLAFQASGISPWSVVFPILTIGLLLSAWLTYSAENIVPRSYRTARTLIYQAVGDVALSLKENTFNPIGKNVVLYFREKDVTNDELRNLIVLYSEQHKLRRVFLAPRGNLQFDPNKGTILLELQQGTYHETVPTDTTLYYIGSFKRYRQFISLSELLPQETQAKLSPKEMNRAELYAYISEKKQNQLPPEREQYELAQRPAKSFSAFIFVLLGIPLGIFWPQFGKSIGMAIELGLALCIPYFYYAIMTFGEDLARGNVIPMWFGAWLPNIIIGCVGFILLWQSCRQR